VVVLEAMKMENQLKAQTAGVVRAIHVRPGDPVEKGKGLIDVGPESGEGPPT
jgi:pyruvate carboxylase subunit B